MNISYLSAQYCSEDKSAILFTDLVIDSENFGNYIADNTTDLGKELLQYVKDNDETVTVLNSDEPTPSVNISQETAIKNIVSFFTEFVNQQAQTKYFIDSTDCLTYLNSKDTELNNLAKAFFAWKELAFKVLRQFILDFKTSEISILDFTSSNLIEKMPTLTWKLDDYTDTDTDIDFNSVEILLDDTFIDKKAHAFETLKSNFLKLKSYSCTEMYFNSSVNNIYVNGDLKAKTDLEALIAEAEETGELVHFKSYSNFWIDLTKEQLETIYKELLKNQLYINNQYWQKTQQLLESENETQLNSISLTFEMGCFGEIQPSSDFTPSL